MTTEKSLHKKKAKRAEMTMMIILHCFIMLYNHSLNGAEE